MEKKNTAFEILKTAVFWLVGCSLYSAGVVCFAVPNSIAQSGVTGIAVILNHLFGIHVGVTNLLLNIPLLILMWIFLGKTTVAKTVCVTVVLSAALDIYAMFLPAYTGDKILASLFCGLCEGAGIGIIMLTGATSGGTDIVARLIHKKWHHISVGKVVLFSDALVITTSMIIFKSVESGLYAIIVIFVSSKVIDSLIYGSGNGKLLMIVTDKADEVSKAMISSSKRGVSIIPAVGAYTGEDKNVLMCVARKNEIAAIIKTVKKVDENTFIIVTEANEILGKGFKSVM